MKNEDIMTSSISGQSLDHDALIAVFKTLPGNLQHLAMQWHIGDTEFNEMALKFLRSQSSP